MVSCLHQWKFCWTVRCPNEPRKLQKVFWWWIESDHFFRSFLQQFTIPWRRVCLPLSTVKLSPVNTSCIYETGTNIALFAQSISSATASSVFPWSTRMNRTSSKHEPSWLMFLSNVERKESSCRSLMDVRGIYSSIHAKATDWVSTMYT
jgi:hypothetical protein